MVENNQRIHLVACVLENPFKKKLKSLFKKICIASDHAGF